ENPCRPAGDVQAASNHGEVVGGPCRDAEEADCRRDLQVKGRGETGTRADCNRRPDPAKGNGEQDIDAGMAVTLASASRPWPKTGAPARPSAGRGGASSWQTPCRCRPAPAAG